MNTTIPGSITCDCGHAESPHSDCTRGYSTDENGKTYCYQCSLAREKELLLTETDVVFYVSSDWKHLTNWIGEKLGKVISVGAVHPWSRRSWGGERRYVTVKDCHGQTWHGTGANGMYCRLTKSKKAA